MYRKFLASLLFLGCSLQSGMAVADTEAFDQANIDVSSYKHRHHHSSHHHSSSHHAHPLANFAVLSNQVAVVTGTNIPWSPLPDTISSGIVVDSTTGSITLPPFPGLFLVEYTVRITKTPFTGTAIATVQLQQTVFGIPTDIPQAAITSNTSVDRVTDVVPQSDTQITGFALIAVTSSVNNVINLLVTITGGNITIPATSGTDANAQMTILQLR